MGGALKCLRGGPTNFVCQKTNGMNKKNTRFVSLCEDQIPRKNLMVCNFCWLGLEGQRWLDRWTGGVKVDFNLKWWNIMSFFYATASHSCTEIVWNLGWGILRLFISELNQFDRDQKSWCAFSGMAGFRAALLAGCFQAPGLEHELQDYHRSNWSKLCQ